MYCKWSGATFVVLGVVGDFASCIRGVEIPLDMVDRFRDAVEALKAALFNENGRMEVRGFARQLVRKEIVHEGAPLVDLLSMMKERKFLCTGYVAANGGRMHMWFGVRLLALDADVRAWYAEQDGHAGPQRNRPHAFDVGSDEDNFM